MSPSRPRAAGSAHPHGRGPNQLLAALPSRAWEALAPQLEEEELEAGQLLAGPLSPITHVYFPDSALLSIITEMADSTPLEIGTVGREGFLGLPLLHGVSSSPVRWVAQVPGSARVLPAAAFKRVLEEHVALREVLLRYAHAYLHQTAQAVACSVHHSVAQRCARWLLVADDTAGNGKAHGSDGSFLLTQEYLGHMLGVRREGVSAAAALLRDSGTISFSRGRIRVVERAGLEAASCECYGLVRREYERVIGRRPARTRQR